MRHKGLPIRLNQNQGAPHDRRGSLIRCEYCGMAYDGDVHDNCPHCLGPRPDGVTPNEQGDVIKQHTTLNDHERIRCALDRGLIGLDEARRYVIDWDRDEPEGNVIYADNKVIYTVTTQPDGVSRPDTPITYGDYLDGKAVSTWYDMNHNQWHYKLVDDACKPEVPPTYGTAPRH